MKRRVFNRVAGSARIAATLLRPILAALWTFVFLLTGLSAHVQDQERKNLRFIITDH